MSIQSDNEVNKQLHIDTIHSISERYHVEESAIREMYESKLEELSSKATITSYLPILIERHVKDSLR